MFKRPDRVLDSVRQLVTVKIEFLKLWNLHECVLCGLNVRYQVFL